MDACDGERELTARIGHVHADWDRIAMRKTVWNTSLSVHRGVSEETVDVEQIELSNAPGLNSRDVVGVADKRIRGFR